MLRPYQQAALTAITENLKAGTRRQLLVLATGLGKTVIAAHLPTTLKDVLPGKMLFIAHRDELISQAVKKIIQWNPHLKVGVEKAEQHAAADCDVIVACNATVGRAGSSRLDKFWEDISVIVIDEVHHVLAKSYMNILADAGVLLPNNQKLLLGLTATPKRKNVKRTDNTPTLDDGDLISLKSIFEKIVFNYPIRTGIKEGYLSPLHGYRVGTETSLDQVKVSGGDFALDELAATVNTTERNQQVVATWKDKAADRQTLCFTVDIQHAKDLAEMFRHHGVLAQPIYGDDPERANKLAGFESGQIPVLCNCSLLTEGFDSPKVSCIVLARPTKSGTLYTQMIGRGTRIHEGKENCVVIDVVDNHKRCSLVTFPSLLGLSPEFDLRGGSATKAIEEMEAIQEKYPGINFSHLTRLEDVKQYVESIDLFVDPYDDEVKENSELSWMPCQDGSYMLSIPDSKKRTDEGKPKLYERMHITPNELDEWELRLSSRENAAGTKLGTFSTLKEIFEVADDVIDRCRKEVQHIMKRVGRDHLATAAARGYLKKLIGNRTTPWCLCPGVQRKGNICRVCGRPEGITAGQASQAINYLVQQRG